jgi:hypothetical protein
MHGITGMSAQEIGAIFEQEVAKAEGKLRECSDGKGWLIAKAVLPRISEILPNDRARAGVGINLMLDDVSVYPYTLRLACGNGALMTQAIFWRSLERIDTMNRDDITWKLRGLVRDCCKHEVFRNVTGRMRRAAAQDASAFLSRPAWPTGLWFHLPPEVIREIRTRFAEGSDRSRYSLMNAVTSVARDTQDVRLRWRLEKLGGDIAFGRVPMSLPAGACRATAA